jgi:hypothetical protein
MEDAIVVAVSEVAEIHARVAFDEDRYPIRDELERHASAGPVVGTSGHSSALSKTADHSDVGAGRYAVTEKVATLGSGPILSFVHTMAAASEICLLGPSQSKTVLTSVKDRSDRFQRQTPGRQ